MLIVIRGSLLNLPEHESCGNPGSEYPEDPYPPGQWKNQKFLHWQRCAPDWSIWGLRKFLSEQPSEVLPEPVYAHTLFREHREHRDPDRLLLPEAHRPVPECRCPGSSRSVLSDNTMDDIQSDLQPVQCRIFFSALPDCGC